MYNGKKQSQVQTLASKTMKITSSSFLENQKIPKDFTCDAHNTNPTLLFSEVPKSAKSLVLIMDDPDAPASPNASLGGPMGTFVHWVLYNISPKEKGIGENSVPPTAKNGKNGAGKEGYIGPCPPSGTHRYFFKLYALDTELKFDTAPSKKDVEEEMQGHILEGAQLIGLYSRSE